MKKLLSLSICVLLLLTVACTSDGAKTAESTNKATSTTAANTNAVNKNQQNLTAKTAANKTDSKAKGAINWLTLAELEEKSKKEPRKVLVDFYTTWCGWCKRMDRDTFQNPEIADYVNENFYAVKFNAETKENVKFKGQEFKFLPIGRKGTNEWAYKTILGEGGKRGVGYPTLAFLDEKLDRINAFPGYKDPHNFDVLAHYIEGGHYDKKDLNEFKKEYKSSFPPPPPRKPRNTNVARKNLNINKQNIKQLNKPAKPQSKNQQIKVQQPQIKVQRKQTSTNN